MVITDEGDVAVALAVRAPSSLPAAGADPGALHALIDGIASDDVDWRAGRGFSLVYDSPPWHHELVRDVAQRFVDENALSHAAFPSAAGFESGVLAMVASVVAGGVPSYGIFASGATESTMIALKAYRDVAHRAHRDDVANVAANVVVPATAHPAFGKAAAYLGVELRRVPVDVETRVPLVDDVLAAADEHTIAIGLSAPCFPFGTIDPIEGIGSAAHRRGIPVHVDAALGGMFLPFLADAVGQRFGHRFGLDVEGVTSVAVDMHKYGYAPKGASALLFARPELRRAAYHIDLGWPGGAYAASGVLGTRSVAPPAGAFAALLALGRTGYAALVGSVLTTTRRFQDGLRDRGFDVVAAPCMSVFAVSSAVHSVAGVAGALQRRGWWMDVQADPEALHFVVFPRHERVVEQFLADLDAAIHEAARSSAPAPVSSYGVMTRSGITTVDTVAQFLDARFDARFDGKLDGDIDGGVA